MQKNPPDNAGDVGLIPVWGRSPGGGNGNPRQYSCLGNPMDRGAWWATVHGVTKSLTQLKLLCTLACTSCHRRPPWKQRWFQGETKTKEESGCSILSCKCPPGQRNFQLRLSKSLPYPCHHGELESLCHLSFFLLNKRYSLRLELKRNCGPMQWRVRSW